MFFQCLFPLTHIQRDKNVKFKNFFDRVVAESEDAEF